MMSNIQLMSLCVIGYGSLPSGRSAEVVGAWLSRPIESRSRLDQPHCRRSLLGDHQMHHAGCHCQVFDTEDILEFLRDTDVEHVEVLCLAPDVGVFTGGKHGPSIVEKCVR